MKKLYENYKKQMIVSGAAAILLTLIICLLYFGNQWTNKDGDVVQAAAMETENKENNKEKNKKNKEKTEQTEVKKILKTELKELEIQRKKDLVFKLSGEEVQHNEENNQLITFSDQEVFYLTDNLTEVDLFTVHNLDEYTYELLTPLGDLEAGEQNIQVMLEKKDSNVSYGISNSFYFEELPIEFQHDFSGMDAEAVLLDYIEDKYINDNNFAFFYYATDTGETYIHNGEKIFNAASTTKLPLNMVYYDKVREGEMDEDATLIYGYGCYEEGAGITDSLYSSGSNVPLMFLLEDSIVNSDNTAANILRNGLGGWAASKEAITKYSSVEMPGEYYSGNRINARFGLDILSHLYENSENYEKLINDMKNASVDYYLQKDFEYYEVAHKYGYYNGNLHDYGIVYTPYPYFIGIYTSGLGNAENIISELNYIFMEYTLSRL